MIGGVERVAGTCFRYLYVESVRAFCTCVLYVHSVRGSGTMKASRVQQERTSYNKSVQ